MKQNLTVITQFNELAKANDTIFSSKPTLKGETSSSPDRKNQSKIEVKCKYDKVNQFQILKTSLRTSRRPLTDSAAVKTLLFCKV